MARLSDIPTVVRSVGAWGMVKRVYHEIQNDHLLMWASALAYSWLFAFFPFLIFLISLLPYLPVKVKAAALRELEIWLRESAFLPREAADTVWANVSELLSRPQAGLLSVGLAVALFSASGGMNMTIGALDKVYDLEKGRPFYTQRPRALVMTVIVAILIVSLLVLLPIGTILLKFVETHGHQYISTPLVLTWRIARYPLAGLLMFTVVHVIYHHGPAIRQRFVFFTPGAVFTVAVWIGLGFGFRLYVEKFGRFNETYGTVGGVAVLLLFFYIDALVLLVGAEINSEIDFEVLKVKRGERDFRTSTVAVDP